MNDKQTLIESIRRHNPSASDEFLMTFNTTALESYLMHLASTRRPRGRDATRIRVTDRPAFSTRPKLCAAV